jgi:hypothetical protein
MMADMAANESNEDRDREMVRRVRDENRAYIEWAAKHLSPEEIKAQLEQAVAEAWALAHVRATKMLAERANEQPGEEG